MQCLEYIFFYMMYSFIGLHYEIDHIKNHPWRRFKSSLQEVFRKYFSRNMNRKKTCEQGMSQQINSSKSESQYLRKWSMGSLQSDILCNELFSEENSILEMDFLDNQTTEKQVMDSYPQSREPESLKIPDSEQSKYEMFFPKMFCCDEGQKTEDCLSSTTKQSDNLDIEYEKESYTPVSSPGTSPLFTGFVTRSSLPSNREMLSSYLNSSNEFNFYSELNHPQYEPMLTEDFTDLSNKHSVKRMEYVDHFSVLSKMSQENILFTLKNTITKDPVLSLNVKLISTSVRKETVMDVSLNSKEQFDIYLFQTCLAFEKRKQCVVLVFIFWNFVCVACFHILWKAPNITLNSNTMALNQTEKLQSYFNFRNAVESLRKRLSFSHEVMMQKKYMIQDSKSSKPERGSQEYAMWILNLPVECSEGSFYHDIQTKKDEKLGHSEELDFGEMKLCKELNSTMSRCRPKKEKYELRKQLSKRLYPFLSKEGMSKKKYHQKTKQASLKFLVESFFKNYSEIEKKDNNEISKIINHLFAYLLSLTSRNQFWPVGRSTPSTLETFFQQVFDSENESERDSMHVEWMRLQTFSSFPASCKVSTVHLARDGFYYTGRSTEAQCFSCRNTYRDWDETSNINAIHLEISPDCDMANGRSERNIAIHDPHRYQERLADSSPPQRTEEGATGQSSSLDTTQEQPAVTTVEEDKEPSKFGSFGILRHQTFFI